MFIINWLQTIGKHVRAFFLGLGALVSGWWRGLTARLRAPFRRKQHADITSEESGTASTPPTDTKPTILSRLQQVWASIRRLFARLLGPVGDVSRQIWQRLVAFMKRLFRGDTNQPGLTIRKIEIKPIFQYNRDGDELRQLLADIANALLIVVGIGMWPYLRFWAEPTISPALAPHGWLPALLLSMLPLIVVYRRWQYTRQVRSSVDWDVLTMATALIGIFGVIFSIVLLLTAWTSFALQWATVICAALATIAWLWAEAVNLYSILIRRPYTLGTLLSLSKSLLFLLSGWLILVYLPIVLLWAGTIQLESATFLLAIFATTASLGVIAAIARYVVVRFRVRLPNFATS